MNPASKNIQQQYQGYIDTPLLWKDHTVLGLEQLLLPALETPNFNDTIPDNLLLGKRVERFVVSELEQIQSIEILLQNKQVQNKKITIGEIDCVLKQEGIPIHLEIVYKFYLYDPAIGSSEIEHWIGPNRKDTLFKKLTKLKDKQLPLIYNEHTEQILHNLTLKADKILQRILFKAQLFTPYQQNVEFNLLNQACLNGFYVYQSDMQQFSSCKFYIPKKVDWLLEVQAEVDWLDFNQFQENIDALLVDKKAPLCWIKFPNGELQKFFVVWWN